MSNLGTVQKVYESFGRGDIPAILDVIAEDAAWEHWPDNTAQAAGVPWYEARNGPQGAAAFFESLSVMEMHDLQVQNLMEGGNQVTATIKISGLRHYTDTAKHIKAGKGSLAGVG